jgi:hypothetical protein
MKCPRILAAILIVISCFSVGSCEDDSVIPPPPRTPPIGSRDYVLYSLERSYNSRSQDRYDELLDEEFLFYFSNADVTGGGWTEGEYWDRAKEINANTNIFNPGYSRPGVDPVSDITLTLTYSEGDDKWTAITPDQGQYPGETWYEKIVTYTLIVQAGDTQYIAQNKQASFVVRAATLEGDEVWRIITWRDDTGT